MNQITTMPDEAISLANNHHNRVQQARRIQEVMDMGNRPGKAKQAAKQAAKQDELEAAKKELEQEKHRSNTLLTYMLIAMIMAFGICALTTFLMIWVVVAH